MPTIASTAIILSGVELAEDVIVEDFCIVGARFKGWSGEKTIIGAGSVIRSHTVIYAGNTIGKGFQSGNKTNIRELNTIGDDVSIGTLSVVEHHVTIGARVRIHTQAFIPEFSVLESGSWIGPNVVLTNAKLPLSQDVKKNLRGPLVCEGAIIGANSTLLPGVSVGKNAMVGAGSVVTKNIPMGEVYAGNPARFIKRLADYGDQYA